MVKDHSARKETHCCHMGYSFRLAARDILYASSHRQDNIPQFFLHQSWSTGWNEKHIQESTWLKFGHHPLQNSPLVQRYCAPMLPLLERVLEVLFFKRVEHLLRFALDILRGVKTATLQLQLHLREEEEVEMGQILRYGHHAVGPRNSRVTRAGWEDALSWSIQLPSCHSSGRFHRLSLEHCIWWACSWSRCGPDSPSSIVEMLESSTAKSVAWSLGGTRRPMSRPQWWPST